MMLTAPHRALALRAFVVLPGALVEGALAVALPWLVTRASLGTPWLGVLPALLVAAALVGALAAPFAAKYFGSRRVVLGGALLAATGLGIATTLLLLGFTAAAFGVALTVIAADGLADVTFNARTPFMARLSRVPLQQFTSANWLWSVGGVALGGAMAGVAISDEMRPTSAITWLAASMAVLAFLVALALTVLMPRDSRISHGVAGERPRAFGKQRSRCFHLWSAGGGGCDGPSHGTDANACRLHRPLWQDATLGWPRGHRRADRLAVVATEGPRPRARFVRYGRGRRAATAVAAELCIEGGGIHPSYCDARRSGHYG